MHHQCWGRERGPLQLWVGFHLTRPSSSRTPPRCPPLPTHTYQHACKARQTHSSVLWLGAWRSDGSRFHTAAPYPASFATTPCATPRAGSRPSRAWITGARPVRPKAPALPGYHPHPGPAPRHPSCGPRACRPLPPAMRTSTAGRRPLLQHPSLRTTLYRRCWWLARLVQLSWVCWLPSLPVRCVYLHILACLAVVR